MRGFVCLKLLRQPSIGSVYSKFVERVLSLRMQTAATAVPILTHGIDHQVLLDPQCYTPKISKHDRALGYHDAHNGRASILA